MSDRHRKSCSVTCHIKNLVLEAVLKLSDRDFQAESAASSVHTVLQFHSEFFSYSDLMNWEKQSNETNRAEFSLGDVWV